MAIQTRLTNTAEIDNALVMRNIIASTRKKFIFAQFGRPDEFKAREGNTIKWFTRSKLSAQTDPLTDNPTARNSAITHTPITETLAFYGDDVTYTENLELTSIVDIPGGTREEISYGAGLTLDTLVRDMLLAAEGTSGITHVYANGKTSADITTGDTTKYTDIIDIATELESDDIPRFDHSKTSLGVYIAIITPEQKKSLMKDTDFKQMVQYGKQNQMWYGELGIIDNVAFVVSTNNADYTYNSITCQKALIFGRDFYGVPAMPGLSGTTGMIPTSTVAFADNEYWTADKVEKMFKVVITNPGGHGDPYAVKTTVAWKALFAKKILDATRGRVYVTAKA